MDPASNFQASIAGFLVLLIAYKVFSYRLEKLKHVRDSETLSLVKDLYSSMTVSSEKHAKDSTEVAISNLCLSLLLEEAQP
ncbi:uncharacterized protein HKW66_Vig0203100 [Vigna angularis]|uniref:Uncharacterized protein n=1 Tax=Phaseolus angularis TaxID=3914 RepID=A0A8T0JUU4_PHAAN|nr:uncharacterized protein HKW66_Vig0203100 [Vigna angularis]